MAHLQRILEALICQVLVHVARVAAHVPHHLLEVWLVEVRPRLWVQGLQRCALTARQRRTHASCNTAPVSGTRNDFRCLPPHMVQVVTLTI
jgi:hypothetical protein